MYDAVSFAELDRQHVELLPVRTVLSMFSRQDSGGAIPNGVTPGQVGQTVLTMLGLSTSSSGSDGSDAAGNGGTNQ
jgi:hypothetical protein